MNAPDLDATDTDAACAVGTGPHPPEGLGPADVVRVPTPGSAPRRRLPRVRARTWLTLVAGLLFALVTVDLLRGGPLQTLDNRFAFDPWHGSNQVVDHLCRAVLKLGQRAWVTPVLLGTAALLSVRRRQWRPLAVSGLGVLLLNLVAGALKLAIGRSNPYSGADRLFVGGTEYPGGHASNAVLTWGLLCWVVARYSWLRVKPAVAAGLVGLVSVLVSAAALYLDWHWISDQVGGVLLGAVLVGIVASADERIPLRSRRRPPVVSPERTGGATAQRASATVHAHQLPPRPQGGCAADLRTVIGPAGARSADRSSLAEPSARSR